MGPLRFSNCGLKVTFTRLFHIELATLHKVTFTVEKVSNSLHKVTSTVEKVSKKSKFIFTKISKAPFPLSLGYKRSNFSSECKNLKHRISLF